MSLCLQDSASLPHQVPAQLHIRQGQPQQPALFSSQPMFHQKPNSSGHHQRGSWAQAQMETPARVSPSSPASSSAQWPSSPKMQRPCEDAGRRYTAQQNEGKWRDVIAMLLVASVISNVAFFLSWQIRQPTMPASPGSDHVKHANPVRLAKKDTDGDGIPDHHDFCPGSKWSPWLSGHATDFDGDGCADGGEDKDRDNDGILDIHDKCPNTPQKYSFVSNTMSDFDADGCADGIEDSDDDNDGIPDSSDACPSTGSGDTSDSSGCSEDQREAAQTSSASSAIFNETDQGNLDAEEEPTRLEAWISTINNAGIEVIVGAILSAVLGHAAILTQRSAQAVKQRMPSSPKGVMKMPSLPAGTSRGNSQTTETFHSIPGSVSSTGPYVGSGAVTAFDWRRIMFRVAVYSSIIYVVHLCTAGSKKQTEAPLS